ncbi:post-GPI attachment to proteins factor 3 [Ostrinia furnacalis]|uniref:post-GPI attachment to proteins factor 3 n=1 Tax=Ostrinia furnacalis TaxID=93504 RepID=UPI00103EBD25|nr:post-GPI attachment to proteins factor 3 [Ostrinia furnacalis]
MKSYIIAFVFFIQQFQFISASEGDRSPFYQKCVVNCKTDFCDKDGSSFKTSVVDELSIWSRMMWNCGDECRYKCMWRTVQGFQERGYAIPKFHGKWPFVRVLGIQEPGSALASLLNLLAHVYMHLEIKRRFTIRSAPLVLFWHVFTAVCVNGWVWSTIFHTRDNPFTEFMDYASALSMVMALFIAAIVRVFHRRRKMTIFMLVPPFMYYIDHVRYLYSGNIDYEYNMMINVVFGSVGSLMWLGWAVLQYLAGRRHAWRVGVFTLLSGAALSLELLDFPPKYNTWDAHALWHLATVPLPLLFYRFVIDDLYFLQGSRVSEKSDFNKLT